MVRLNPDPLTNMFAIIYIYICTEYDILLLCGSSNGFDGTSSSAGAIGYPGMPRLSLSHDKMDATKFLKNNDTTIFYTLYDHGRCSVNTGATGTDVMDIHVLMIRNCPLLIPPSL